MEWGRRGWGQEAENGKLQAGVISEEVKTFQASYCCDWVCYALLHFTAQQLPEEYWAGGDILVLKEWTLREFSFLES